MRPTPLRTAATLVLLALPLAACGGDGGGGTASTRGGSGDGPTVTVHAKDSLKFDKDRYTTAAGEVTFVYVNDGAAAHTLLIRDVEGFELKIGDEDEGTVTLEPGTYEVYCDLAGHEQAGMLADLEVS